MKDINVILKDFGIEVEDKEKFEKVFFENYKTKAEVERKDTEIANLKSNLDQRDLDLKEVKKQLDASGGDKEKIDSLSKELESLREKYDNAEKQHKDSMAKQQYEYAVKEVISDINFSSNSAKELFEQKLIKQNFPIEDGKILGLNDFVDSYKKTDASAFVEKDVEAKPKFSAKNAGKLDASQTASESHSIVGRVR